MKVKMSSKIISAVLAAIMMLTALPAWIFASDTDSECQESGDVTPVTDADREAAVPDLGYTVNTLSYEKMERQRCCRFAWR